MIRTHGTFSVIALGRLNTARRRYWAFDRQCMDDCGSDGLHGRSHTRTVRDMTPDDASNWPRKMVEEAQ